MFAVGPSTQRRLALLSWLIGERRLDIKIAFAKQPRRGVFHEKVGIFRDFLGDRVAITGSANETRGGLVENFEVVDVFTSWDASTSRVGRKEENFEALWQDATDGLEVVPIPEAVRRELLTRIPPQGPEAPAEREAAADWTSLRATPLTQPAGVEPRQFQETALSAWSSNDGVGILSMATPPHPRPRLQVLRLLRRGVPDRGCAGDPHADPITQSECVR